MENISCKIEKERSERDIDERVQSARYKQALCLCLVEVGEGVWVRVAEPLQDGAVVNTRYIADRCVRVSPDPPHAVVG